VDLNARGINSVFFESPPISPDFIKKYWFGGKLVDFKEDYFYFNFAQAIGRVFRKRKSNLYIIFGRIEDWQLDLAKKYLNSHTTSNILEDVFSATKLKKELILND
jgi:hypothetical protein